MLGHSAAVPHFAGEEREGPLIRGHEERSSYELSHKRFKPFQLIVGEHRLPASNRLAGLRMGLSHWMAWRIHIVVDHEAKDRQCLCDLRSTDPRDDKISIERSEDDLLKDSYMWILADPAFGTGAIIMTPSCFGL
jgi:hypothetical protein